MGYPYDDGPNAVKSREFVCQKCGRKFIATSAEYHDVPMDEWRETKAEKKIDCWACGGIAYSYRKKWYS